MHTNTLSNLQYEILKLYSTDLKDAELKELKTVLAAYFAKKAIKEADKIWQERAYTEKDMDAWLSE
ncbi:MAG: hypothetical protein QX196_16290 [Methylococcaceae bacterium]